MMSSVSSRQVESPTVPGSPHEFPAPVPHAYVVPKCRIRICRSIKIVNALLQPGPPGLLGEQPLALVYCP